MTSLIIACLLAGPPASEATYDAAELDAARHRLQAAGMATLGGWSAINIGSGAAGLALAEGRNRYFSEMNLYWGLVNGLIAGVGFGVLARDLGRDRDTADVLQEYRKARLAFLINGGLDLVYISGGLLLWQAAETSGAGSPDALQTRLVGYGQSVVLQGSFLLAFDAAMYVAHGLVRRDLTGGARSPFPVWNITPSIGRDGAGVQISGRF